MSVRKLSLLSKNQPSKNKNAKIMKITILTITATVALTSLAPAVVILSDNFDYADGSLVTNGGWTNHSGTTGDLLLAGGKAVVQHGTPSEDANIAFTAVSGKIFYGIDFSVGALAAAYAGSDNEYFAHFKDNGFGFSARMDIVAPTGAGDYSVGIASDASTADSIWATDLIFGTTYRAVVEFDQDNNQAKLWINASLETDTSILGDDQADPGNSIIEFALRQSDSSENEAITVDGLVVGTTFADVVTAVPEPSSIALLGLGGLALILRRRR